MLKKLKLTCFLITAFFASYSANTYELVGGYNTGINPEDYNLSANIGVRKDADWGIDPAKGDPRGEPYTHVCFYGWDAEVFAQKLSETNPEIVVTFFELDSGVQPLANTVRQQDCYKSFPANQTNNVGIFITPGVYNGDLAKPFNAGNKSYPRYGCMTIAGLASHPRPILNHEPSGTTYRHVRQDCVFMQHLQTSGIGMSFGAGNLYIRGVTFTRYKVDCVIIDDPETAFYDDRKEYLEIDETGRVVHVFEDVEFFLCGNGGNTRHAVYSQARNKVVLYGNHIHSYENNGSIGFKAPMEEVALTNCIISTVGTLERWKFANNYAGTKLHDGSSSGVSFIDNCLFISAVGKVGNRWITADPIFFAARRPIYAGDRPYQYRVDPEYMLKTTWDYYKDNTWQTTDPDSPWSYKFVGRIGVHYVDLTQFQDGTNTSAYLVNSKGTWPRSNAGQFSTDSEYFDLGELNDDWIELSLTYMDPAYITTNVTVEMPGCYDDDDTTPCETLLPNVKNPDHVYNRTVKYFEGAVNEDAFLGYDENGKHIRGPAPDYIPDREVFQYTGLAMVPTHLKKFVEEVPPIEPPPIEPPPVDDELIQVERVFVNESENGPGVDLGIRITLPKSIQLNNVDTEYRYTDE